MGVLGAYRDGRINSATCSKSPICIYKRHVFNGKLHMLQNTECAAHYFECVRKSSHIRQRLLRIPHCKPYHSAAASQTKQSRKRFRRRRNIGNNQRTVLFRRTVGIGIVSNQSNVVFNCYAACNAILALGQIHRTPADFGNI